jgi:hypothetical protein
MVTAIEHLPEIPKESGFVGGNSMSVEIRSPMPTHGVFAAVLIMVGLFWSGLSGCSGDPPPAPTPVSSPPGAVAVAMPKKRIPLPALRFSERGHVDLLDSVGLIDLNGAFTIELWHRVEGAGSLAGDDPLPPAGAITDVSRSAPGWFLRKVHLDDAEYNTVMRYEFLMGRPAPEPRFSVVSIPVVQAGPWHHVAVSKSDDELRLFVDGVLVAVQPCAGKVFVNSSGPISLGVPLLSPEDRKLWGDIRGFRLSKTGRYHDKFIPQEVFDNDPQTLALLDFSRQDGNELPDLATSTHSGVFVPGFERSFYAPNGAVFTQPVGIRWIHDEEQPDKNRSGPRKHPPRTAGAPMSTRLASISSDPTRYNEVRIQGRIDSLGVFLVTREYTECHFQGPPPEQLTLNGIAWSPLRDGEALHSEDNTVHLPHFMDFEDISVVVKSGRGQVEHDFLASADRSCRIRIVDPEPGSDVYDIIVRFGVALPELPEAAEHVPSVAGAAPKSPQSQSPSGPTPSSGGTGMPPARYVALYDKYGSHAPAWDGAARMFLTAAEESRVLLYDPRADSDRQVARRHSADQNDLPLLIRSGTAALRAGCDDPLLLVVLSRYLLASHNLEDASVLTAQAESSFAKSRYPNWCTVLVSIERLAQSSAPTASTAAQARCAADLGSLATGPFTADEPQQLLAEITGMLQRINFSQTRGPVVWALANNEQIDPWLQHMVLARYHLEVGWYAGAPGGQSMPRPQADRAWKARLRQARAQLLAASKINSQRLNLAAELEFVSECLRTDLGVQLYPARNNMNPLPPGHK